jgi:hypothetical protein
VLRGREGAGEQAAAVFIGHESRITRARRPDTAISNCFATNDCFEGASFRTCLLNGFGTQPDSPTTTGPRRRQPTYIRTAVEYQGVKIREPPQLVLTSTHIYASYTVQRLILSSQIRPTNNQRRRLLSTSFARRAL